MYPSAIIRDITNFIFCEDIPSHADIILIPGGGFVVQAEQNRGIRLVQLKSSVSIEVFQKNQGILLCRLLSVQPVGQAYCG